MKQPPCSNCPKAGCGSYHDECPDYQEFRSGQLKEYERRKQLCNERYDLGRIKNRHISAAAKYNKKP